MRGWIYDRSLLHLTSGWYAQVLSRVPVGATLLDVGIGTAGALITQADLLRERDLHVVGVDIDEDYVKRARRRIARAGLADRITVHHEPLGEHVGGPYEAVYFAASFMLFPEPEDALRRAQDLLKPGGQVFFTQTFQDRRDPLMEKLKPTLVRLTSIDFGRVTYEQAFLSTLEAGGLDVQEHVVLKAGKHRSDRLVVAAPEG